jgi:signal transduction histidine kinase
MRGAEEGILRRLHWTELRLDQPYETVNLVASAFARYPYPEAFFGWGGKASGKVVFYARADRSPEWLADEESESPFPVVVLQNPLPARHLLAPLVAAGAEGRQYSVSQTLIAGTEYQVVARLMYRDSRRDRLEGVFGFLVNLSWVRQQYFPSLVDQVEQIAGPSGGLRMMMFDEHGALVAGVGDQPDSGPTAIRPLRPLFFDPTLVGASRLALSPREWNVEVRAANTPAFTGSPDRTLAITASAGLVMALGLLLTGRAVRASADLAKVRSDFVASVTHELKTPLTTIRTIADTFVLGHPCTPEQVMDYARILDGEATRLIRLVDNLLAYSRVTDVSEVYLFEPCSPADAIEDALRRFQPQFAHSAVEVLVELAPDLPLIRADRVALALVFDNLIDNALRYSKEPRWIGVSAHHDKRFVRMQIKDRGAGIPAEEQLRVQQRFVRGRNAASSGSGLGLAIARRVVQDHAGHLVIESEVGVGTTVTLTIPVISASL